MVTDRPAPIREFAPAKINLALHVTGRRADGYHLLESLVAFAGTGDVVTATPGRRLCLERSGAFSGALGPVGDDLVCRAARRLQQTLSAAGGRSPGAHLLLQKNLPVAAGLGGGSADAAATLRALARLWRPPLQRPSADLAALLSGLAPDLGADIPMCLRSEPALVTGIGERIRPYAGLPDGIPLVLVNPGPALSTPAVFAALRRRENPPLPPLPQAFSGPRDLAAWLRRARNDLFEAARSLVPETDEVLAALRGQPSSLLARMSGSGATCFALFETAAAAHAAAETIRAARPDWWVVPTALENSPLPGGRHVGPE